MPPSPDRAVRIRLTPYSADIEISSLPIGIDNIHYDVFLSPQFVEFARKYLLDLVRQTAQEGRRPAFETKSSRPPETSTFRKLLGDLLQASLTQSKYRKNIELDLLLWLALVKFLTREISEGFSTLLLEYKEQLRNQGGFFEQSQQAHLLRARIADLAADRRNIYRRVGQSLYQVLIDLEEGMLAKARRALFGEEFTESYAMLQNRLLFVEGGKDEFLYLEHYVLLGNFQKDPDRLEVFEGLLQDLVREFVLPDQREGELQQSIESRDRLKRQALALREELTALTQQQELVQRKREKKDGLLPRLLGDDSDSTEVRRDFAQLEKRRVELQRRLEELGSQLDAAKGKADFLTEQHQNKLGEYLNEPQNARRLFDRDWPGDRERAGAREGLLEEWLSKLREQDILLHVLAGYELRNLYLDYCPPVHLLQLKRALVFKEELKRVERILQQFPARQFSLRRIEEMARALRRYPKQETRALAIRFAEDCMKLRRDLRNYQRITALMESLHLIESERVRELSRANQSLHEFLLPEEQHPAEDRVVGHAVIKADVRGSTKITEDLLARGLNPASHFSLHLYEPVKRILERYGAVKVFIEGDAILLAIYETETNRSHQRAVAKACLLSREILSVSQAYNTQAESSDLPRLELGVGVAFQNSAPTMWMDSDSRILISRALNLSDRLASCSKLARRLMKQNTSPFNLFLFQTVVEGTPEEEAEELLLRYNLNGVELNDEGFQKLSEEIFLATMELKHPMPWGEDRGIIYFGEVPLADSLEPLVIRKAWVRQLLPDGRVGPPGARAYYEVCTSPKVIEMAQGRVLAASRRK
jgi:class 3 adenylate cyclase